MIQSSILQLITDEKNKKKVEYIEYEGEDIYFSITKSDFEGECSIVSLCNTKELPTIIKPEGDILTVQLNNYNLDVQLVLPHNSFVTFIKEKNCYIVTTKENGKEMILFVNDKIPAVCTFNLMQNNGEILYPIHKFTTKFKFKGYNNIFGDNNSKDYIIKEFTTDNTKTVNIVNYDPEKMKKKFEAIIKDGNYKIEKLYETCVYISNEGLIIPPPDTLIYVADCLVYNEGRVIFYRRAFMPLEEGE